MVEFHSPLPNKFECFLRGFTADCENFLPQIFHASGVQHLWMWIKLHVCSDRVLPRIFSNHSIVNIAKVFITSLKYRTNTWCYTIPSYKVTTLQLSKMEDGQPECVHRIIDRCKLSCS